MFYEIYLIKHCLFLNIHVKNFILSQLGPSPTTDEKLF